MLERLRRRLHRPSESERLREAINFVWVAKIEELVGCGVQLSFAPCSRETIGVGVGQGGKYLAMVASLLDEKGNVVSKRWSVRSLGSDTLEVSISNKRIGDRESGEVAAREDFISSCFDSEATTKYADALQVEAAGLMRGLK